MSKPTPFNYQVEPESAGGFPTITLGFHTDDFSFFTRPIDHKTAKELVNDILAGIEFNEAIRKEKSPAKRSKLVNAWFDRKK